MVELYSGVVRSFTAHMEIIGNKPMVLFHTDSKGNRVKLGKVRRIFASKDKQ